MTRTCLRLAAATVLCVGTLLALALMLLDRPLSAPDWLRDKVTERLAASLETLDISFGDIAVVQSRRNGAQIVLRDVDVSERGGAPLVALSHVRFGLNPARLLTGQDLVRELEISGGFVMLRREVDGQIGLAFGMQAQDAKLPGLTEMFAALDAALADPSMAGLRRVAVDGLTLRYEDARARRGWTVDGGRIELRRIDRAGLALQGDFALLTGGAEVSTVAVNATRDPGADVLNFGITVGNVPSAEIGTQSPALTWLEALDAPISGALRAALFSDGRLGPLNATLQMEAGVVQPTDGTRPIPFDGARTYFTYTPEAGTLTFDEISIDSPWGQLSAHGRADLGDMSSGLPQDFLAQMEITHLRVEPGTLLENPVEIAGAEMDFRLTVDPFTFDLGRLRLTDPDLPLSAQGRVMALRDGWDVALDARAARLSPAQVTAFWPVAHKPRTRDWLQRNVLSGTLVGAEAAIRWHPGGPPVLHVDTGFENATVRYARRLPAVEKAQGRLTIHRHRLSILVEDGRMRPAQGGDLDVAGSSFVVPDTRIKGAPAEVNITGTGSLTAGLSFLDADGLQLMRKAGLSSDLAQGRASVEGQIRLPLRKGLTPADITYSFAGSVQEARSETLVKNRVLAAPVLRFAVDPTAIQVAGRGTLDGVAFDGQWKQPLGAKGTAGLVTAQVDLSEAAAQQFGITLPDGMIRGAGTGDLTLTLARGAPVGFALTTDLRGLGLSIPAIGWRHVPAATGRFDIAGQLGETPQIDRFEIDTGGLSGAAELTLAQGGGLGRLAFARLRVGDWLDGPVIVTGQGAGRAPSITLAGGRVDLRRAPFGASGDQANTQTGAVQATEPGPVPMSIALDTLQISDTLQLTDFEGRFESRAGLQGEFVARLNDAAQLTGTLLPTARGTAVRIRAQDAGRAVAAAGLLQTVSGGALTLSLQPVGTPGTFDGQFEITGARLRDAPAIGALLDAISIVGLLDQLEGPGIYFGKVDGRFRLTPDQVILREASATGPSMGITLDGFYDLGSKALDMQGVLSPLYMVNAIGALLSRRGEGLIGFNFLLSGTSDSPRVQVNPLSILTPGMFREIFRRPPPKLSQ